MNPLTIDAFAKLLQFSISPIALISGAGLVLLSITNRLGRTIDRSRALVRELESGAADRFANEHKTQLAILLYRSRALRSAVLCNAGSILFAALMMMLLAFQVFAGWDLHGLILAMLFLSLLAISASVLFLFADVSAGLRALYLEVGRHIKQ